MDGFGSDDVPFPVDENSQVPAVHNPPATPRHVWRRVAVEILPLAPKKVKVIGQQCRNPGIQNVEKSSYLCVPKIFFAC